MCDIFDLSNGHCIQRRQYCPMCVRVNNKVSNQSINQNWKARMSFDNGLLSYYSSTPRTISVELISTILFFSDSTNEHMFYLILLFYFQIARQFDNLNMNSKQNKYLSNKNRDFWLILNNEGFTND